MQLVPLSESNENQGTADTSVTIKEEQTEPDVEVTGMELSLGDPMVIKSDNNGDGVGDNVVATSMGGDKKPYKRHAPFIVVTCPKCGDSFNRTDKLYKHILNHYGKMAYLKARTTPHACMKWECGYCGFYYRHEKYHQSENCEKNREFAKAGCPTHILKNIISS